MEDKKDLWWDNRPYPTEYQYIYLKPKFHEVFGDDDDDDDGDDPFIAVIMMCINDDHDFYDSTTIMIILIIIIPRWSLWLWYCH